VRGYVVADRDIVIANVGGDLRAFANRCPHQGGRLNRAVLADTELICPWHQWRFDTRTGRACWPEGYERLATYPVKVEDGQIFVAVE
jgi:nitrite reductase/ring-hydroxylating ferredoxin subunit